MDPARARQCHKHQQHLIQMTTKQQQQQQLISPACNFPVYISYGKLKEIFDGNMTARYECYTYANFSRNSTDGLAKCRNGSVTLPTCEYNGE